jgi:hypothetical protein
MLLHRRTHWSCRCCAGHPLATYRRVGCTVPGPNGWYCSPGCMDSCCQFRRFDTIQTHCRFGKSTGAQIDLLLSDLCHWPSRFLGGRLRHGGSRGWMSLWEPRHPRRSQMLNQVWTNLVLIWSDLVVSVYIIYNYRYIKQRRTEQNTYLCFVNGKWTVFTKRVQHKLGLPESLSFSVERILNIWQNRINITCSAQ